MTITRKPAKAAAEPEPEKSYTVERCLADYFETRRKSNADAQCRTRALILPTLGPIACKDLTKDTLKDWRDAMADAAPRLRTRKGTQQQYRTIDQADPEDRRRREASANRVLTILKAALNAAWRDEKIADDRAWRRVEPFEQVDAARIRHLSITELQRLINAAEGEFRNLVQGALLSGCRYGELAALDVEDFNIILHGEVEVGQLHVRTSKSGKGRHVILTKEGTGFFRSLSAGRDGAEPMLRRPDGGRWLKSHQFRPMSDACRRARIKPPASFHTLRHTYASLAIMNSTPLLVVARNLGHSDTRMVERHYGHMAPGYVIDAIQAGAPSFGIVDSNVTSLRGVL